MKVLRRSLRSIRQRLYSATSINHLHNIQSYILHYLAAFTSLKFLPFFVALHFPPTSLQPVRAQKRTTWQVRWHFFSNFVANISVFHPFLSLKGQNMQKLALAGFKRKVIWSNSSESAPSLHIFSHSFKEMDAIYLPGRGQNEIVENCCQQSRSDSQAVQSKPSNRPANIGLSKNLCLFKRISWGLGLLCVTKFYYCLEMLIGSICWNFHNHMWRLRHQSIFSGEEIMLKNQKYLRYPAAASNYFLA